METEISFLSETYEIEGLLEKNSPEQGVIVTHPHPLYGGDMYNPVVDTLVAAYQQKGYTTLRFNFRGTGSSQGYFDDGKGEQQDVLAAFSILLEMGIEKIDLAGYSFGAWVNAQISRKDLPYTDTVMVSPPIGFMAFDGVTSISNLKLVVTGSRDDIAPPGLIQKALPGWNSTAEFEIIDGADHFYSGRLNELETVLQAAL
jgi:alpha/beta superfamily hydrolase